MAAPLALGLSAQDAEAQTAPAAEPQPIQMAFNQTIASATDYKFSSDRGAPPVNFTTFRAAGQPQNDAETRAVEKYRMPIRFQDSKSWRDRAEDAVKDKLDQTVAALPEIMRPSLDFKGESIGLDLFESGQSRLRIHYTLDAIPENSNNAASILFREQRFAGGRDNDDARGTMLSYSYRF